MELITLQSICALTHAAQGNFKGSQGTCSRGAPLAGYGECRSVVRAYPQSGKPDGGIHGIVKIEQLERNECLIVVGSYDPVVHPGSGIAVHTVWHTGPGKKRRWSRLPQKGKGRSDDCGLLVTESSVFAIVRVEPGQGYMWVLAARADEETCQQTAHAHNFLPMRNF